MRPAWPRAAELLLLGVVPVAALVLALSAYAGDDRLALDFHHEVYRQAEAVVDGRDAYELPDADLSDRSNLVWPMAAVLPVVPLTALPPGGADWLATAAVLASLVGALRLLDVRDWRVYGAFGLWPEVVGEMRVAHLTPVLAVLAALAWRHRDRRLVPGVLVGLAIGIKFFVWPLVAWLAATRRFREAALAAVVAGASVLLVLPFVGLHDYVRALLNLGRAFDQDSYTVFGLFAQAGASDSVARAATLLTGVALLAATWRYRSFTLAIATALVVSPIVWLDYFALAALPLALARPRLSWVWLLPVATWGLEGAGIGIGDVGGTVRLLVVFAIVLGVAFAAERERERERDGAPSPAGRAPGAQVRARLRRSPVA